MRRLAAFIPYPIESSKKQEDTGLAAPRSATLDMPVLYIESPNLRSDS